MMSGYDLRVGGKLDRRTHLKLPTSMQTGTPWKRNWSDGGWPAEESTNCSAADCRPPLLGCNCQPKRIYIVPSYLYFAIGAKLKHLLRWPSIFFFVKNADSHRER